VNRGELYTASSQEGWFLSAVSNQPVARIGFFGCDPFDGGTDAPASARVLEHIKARAAEGSVLHIEALMMIQLQ